MISVARLKSRVSRFFVSAKARPVAVPNLRADVLVELAEVLRAGGDEQASSDAVEEAARLYERKGNLAAMALIRG